MREHVVSADGTRVGWERVGEGPPVVVLHGGGRAGKHYRALANVLASRFAVLLVDRRGRGDSGPGSVERGLEEEIADLNAVLRATGATRLFGHSAGGAISLAAARALPLSHLALYEPPVLIEELLPLDWVPAFEAALARGRDAVAFVTFARGLQMTPRGFPPWFLAAGAWFMLRTEHGREMVTLLRTLPRDLGMVRSLPKDLAAYRTISCPTLLLGGASSPPYLHEMVARLEAALPNVRRVDLPGVGHNAPDMEAPERVGEELARFFAD